MDRCLCSVGSSPTQAIVSALIRAIVHQIRTPLSVISNELEALRPRLSSAEIEREERKVQDISRFLRDLSQFSSSGTLEQELDLLPILLNLSLRSGGNFRVRTETNNTRLRGDPRLLSLALSSLVDVLRGLGSSAGNDASDLAIFECVVSRSGEALEIRIADGSGQDELDEGSREYQGLTAFCSGVLDTDSVLPPCIESILIAHNADVRIRIVSGIQVRMTFHHGTAVRLDR